MIRKIKTLVIALGAMTALSVVATGAVQAADNFKYGASSGTIAGSQQGGNHVLTIAGGRSFECSTVTFNGTFTEAEPTSQSVTPTHEGCKVDVLGEEFPVTVDRTDCYVDWTYTFTFQGVRLGHAILRCPDSDQLHVEVLADAAPHTSLLCEYTFDEQGPLGTIEYENNAGSPNHVTVKHDLTGISYTRTNNNGGSLICGPSSGSATYVGDSTVKAKNTSGESVSFEAV